MTNNTNKKEVGDKMQIDVEISALRNTRNAKTHFVLVMARYKTRIQRSSCPRHTQCCATRWKAMQIAALPDWTVNLLFHFHSGTLLPYKFVIWMRPLCCAATVVPDSMRSDHWGSRLSRRCCDYSLNTQLWCSQGCSRKVIFGYDLKHETLHPTTLLGQVSRQFYRYRIYPETTRLGSHCGDRAREKSLVRIQSQ